MGSGAVQGAAGTGWACVICVRPQGHACWFWPVPRPCFGHAFSHSPRIVRWTWESVAHTSAPRCTSWDLSPAPRVRGQTHQEHVPVSGWVSWLTVSEAPHPGQSTLRSPVLAPPTHSPPEVHDTRHELQGQWPVRGTNPSERTCRMCEFTASKGWGSTGDTPVLGVISRD